MLKNISKFFNLILIVLLAKIATAQVTLTNPILTGFYPDPSIVKVGADYYSVHSTFSYFPGLPIMHSRDLKNWKQVGNVIDRPSQMEFMGERMTRGLFAPAIAYYKGTYYVTCTDIDHEGNFVVTSKNPGGPYINPVKIPEVKGIDPSIYFDEATDKAYIVYNSDAPDRKPLYSGHRTIRIYEFDYKNLKVVGEEHQLVNGGVDLSKKPVWIEGPHIMKRNDWYILYAAEGGTSVNHSQVALRSKDIWGPYVPFEGNPVLTQRGLPEDRQNPITSAGHAQFIEGPDGNWYSIFLAVRPYEGDFYNTGREMFIAPLTWVNDWPMIEHGEKEIAYKYKTNIKEVKQKGSIPQSGNFSYTMTFDKGLNLSMLFLRTVDSSSFKTSASGLTLNLKPETISELTNPSFIGKRQQHLNSTAETLVSFAPKNANEKAGLVIFQDERHYYFIAKAKNGDGKDMVQLIKSKDKTTELVTEVALTIPSSKVNFKIKSEGALYSFWYSTDGKKWNLLKDKVDGKFLSTKVANSFIGCTYGMYATSTGEKSDNTATFKFLKYSGNDPVLK
ncbi:MAG: glycoside hydrolase family 43 protein [Cytophagaceae bacterium]|nr:glycoside hydrolase family 43 protein [Cytophagaceae bacterium]MBL0300560.1 glycoside hydrolase family 43 protein [Cytophagaceae bacterium]MBL0327494.1 glycoside hydrolase family 43 protein [Cytophagaceae bacterium]